MKKMKLKRYGGGVKKLTTKPVTKQDSLDLYNSSVKVLNYYKGKKYKEDDKYLSSRVKGLPIVNAHKDNLERANKFKNKKNVIAPGVDGKAIEVKSTSIKYREDLDENKYKQRESAASILDTRSPMQLFDKRIIPTVHGGYNNNVEKDPLYGDAVDIYSYDPIQVKPWQMMTPDEKAERVKKYGVPDGVEYGKPKIDKNLKLVKKPTTPTVKKTKPQMKLMSPVQSELEIPATPTIDKTVVPKEIEPMLESNKKPVIKGKRVVGAAHNTNGIRLQVKSNEYEATPARVRQKKSSLQRYQKVASGLQDVTVPEAGSMGNVLSSGLSMASTGMTLGGPWGAVGGAALGIGMGVLEKDKMDRDNRVGKAQNELRKKSRAYAGVDHTTGQPMQSYADGTPASADSKIIEAEGGEIIAEKVGDRFKKVKELRGPSHSQGGEVIAVKEGQTIYPKKYRKQVLEAFKDGAHNRLESLRLKLPKDKPNKTGEAGDGWRMVNGVPVNNANHGSVNSPTPYGQPGNTFADATGVLAPKSPGNPYDVYASQTKQGSLYAINPSANNSAIDPINQGALPGSVPSTLNPIDQPAFPATQNGVGEGVSNTANKMGGADFLRYANIANNLIRGNQKQPEIKENYLDPQLLKYRDQSEPIRKESRRLERASASQTRNISGGNAAVLRAGMAQGSQDNFNRIEGINERELTRFDETNNYNTGLKNSAMAQNLARKDMYGEMKLKQRAVKEDYTNAATQEAAQLGETMVQDRNLQNLDKQKAGILNNMYMYSVDPVTGQTTFNPNNPNPLAGQLGKQEDTSTTTDSKGNTKTTTKKKARKGFGFKLRK